MAQSLAAATERGGVYNAWANVAAAQTDSPLVTGQTGRRIRVLAVFANATDAGVSTITFNSKPAGAGTAITPTFELPLNGGFVLPEGEGGWFETNTDEGLTVTTAAASATSIIVVWTWAK